MRKYTKKLKQGLALLLALTFIVSSIPLSNVKAAEDPNTTLDRNPDGEEVVPEEHKHTYENKKYYYNETSHWLVCDDKECSAEDTDNAVAHIYGNLDNDKYGCTECSYVSHVHTYTNTYNHDATKHWLECSDTNCPDTNKGKKEAVHVYGNLDNDKYGCTECSYVSHVHTYTNTYNHDKTNHWLICDDENCPDTNKGKKEEAVHVYTDLGDGTYKCNTCGYVHEHTYTAQIIEGLGDSNHLLICSDLNCPDTNRGKKEEAHKFVSTGSSSYKCTVCGFNEIHTHIYEYKNPNYDETNHWYECIEPACPDTNKGKKSEAKHVYTDLDNNKYGCRDCEYVHKHTYGNSKNYNETNHWYECTDPNCPDINKGKKEEAKHFYIDLDNNKYGCRDCEHEHEHTYGTSRNYDKTNHWFECTDPTCPATDKGKKDVQTHVITGFINDISKCGFCAYKPDSHSGQPVESLTVKDITNSEQVSAKNPIDVKIKTVTGTLEELLGISSSEKAQGVNVWLSSENIASTVSDTDKQLIAKKKGNGTVAMYLDLSLYKRVGTNEPSKVTELTGDLSVTVDLPEEIIKDNRTFSAVRVHNGVAEKLPVKLDTNKKTGTFQTTGFSTYAIVYEDTPASTNTGSTSGSTSNTTTTTTNTTTTSTTPSTTQTKADETLPDTGDSSNIMLWATLTVVLAVVILIIKKKELDTKQD